MSAHGSSFSLSKQTVVEMCWRWIHTDHLLLLVQSALRGPPLNETAVGEMVELIIALLALSDLPSILPDSLPGIHCLTDSEYSDYYSEAE